MEEFIDITGVYILLIDNNSNKLILIKSMPNIYLSQQYMLSISTKAIAFVILLSLLYLSQAGQIFQQKEPHTQLSSQPDVSSQSSTSSNFTFWWIFFGMYLLSNLFLLLILVCVSLKYKVKPYQRERFNDVQPQLMFKTLTNCQQTQQEYFQSKICYHLNQPLASAPCYIIQKYYEAFAPIDKNVVLYPCQRCLGVTKTISIEKFGKRICRLDLIGALLVIYPLVLIYTLLANYRCWRKYFCGECGLEKVSRTNSN